MNHFFQLTKRQQVLHILLYGIGVIFMPLGVVLTIKSNLGAGGYDALNFALADRFQLNVSITIYTTAMIVVFLAAIVRRSLPRITTFIASFFLGIFTDLWNGLLQGIQVESTIFRILSLFVGVVIISISVAAYVISVLPCNPTDDFVVALSEKGIRLSYAKLALDVVCVILAFLLGGQIGIGTIVCTLCIGPLVEYFTAKVKGS